ncbi:uncharacterized protein LOC144364522 [Saccoglossus kowalevskii]
MDLLEHRYGQPHKIISAFMRSLWDLPEPSEDYHSLRNFYDKLESHIRGLKSLGKKDDSYGDLLVPIVMDKLPGQIRKQIARDHGKNEWTLPDIRKAIQKEIEAIHAGDATDVQSNSNPAVTAAFHTRSETTRKQFIRKPRICTFCKGSHPSNECKAVTDVDKRREIVQHHGLCYNCFGNH